MVSSRSTTRLAAALLLGSFVTATCAQEPAAIHYASGGVGLNSQEELTSRQDEFSLKLIFAEKITGSYLADVGVSITDASGATVLEATSDGPWFFAKLPKGVYHVTATFQGVAQTTRVSVPVSGLKVEYLRWEPTGE